MSKIRLVEVGPRDGLQNEKTIIPTDLKLKFIKGLVAAGIKNIEATSFVSPKAIPQMGDAIQLYQGIVDDKIDQEASLSCLVPNLKGFDIAQKLGVKEIALFTATSEVFSSKNTNATLNEVLKRMTEVAKLANEKEIKIRGYLSTVFGCPYEGLIDAEKVYKGIDDLLKLGCYEVSLGDTIGVANPLQVSLLVDGIKQRFDLSKIAMHFHDTRGMALTNIYESFNLGIRTFDASAGGLGGCPYAQGATGNVATEDICYLFESLGVDHGVKTQELALASREILDFLNKDSPSRVRRVLLNS